MARGGPWGLGARGGPLGGPWRAGGPWGRLARGVPLGALGALGDLGGPWRAGPLGALGGRGGPLVQGGGPLGAPWRAGAYGGPLARGGPWGPLAGRRGGFLGALGAQGFWGFCAGTPWGPLARGEPLGRDRGALGRGVWPLGRFGGAWRDKMWGSARGRFWPLVRGKGPLVQRPKNRILHCRYGHVRGRLFEGFWWLLGSLALFGPSTCQGPFREPLKKLFGPFSGLRHVRIKVLRCWGLGWGWG